MIPPTIRPSGHPSSPGGKGAVCPLAARSRPFTRPRPPDTLIPPLYAAKPGLVNNPGPEAPHRHERAQSRAPQPALIGHATSLPSQPKGGRWRRLGRGGSFVASTRQGCPDTTFYSHPIGALLTGTVFGGEPLFFQSVGSHLYSVTSLNVAPVSMSSLSLPFWLI